MSYTEIQIQTTKANINVFEALLLEQGAVAITIQDAGNEEIFSSETSITPIWKKLTVTGLFSIDTDLHQLTDLLTSLKANEKITNFNRASIKNEPWERACLKDFHPIKVSNKLWICPIGKLPPEPRAPHIEIDPGMAFGTGTHPTTLLCLEWLDKQINSKQHVIDYGCGSGILSLASLKLGAKQVTAIDIDQQALLATKNNASANQISLKKLNILPQDAPLNTQADLLIANILSSPLIELASTFASLLKPEGKIFLSGLLENQADRLIKAYSSWFCIRPYKTRDKWIGLSGFRHSNEFQRNI